MKRVSIIGPINADIMVVGNYGGDWKGNFEWESPAEIEFYSAGSSGYTIQDFNRLGSRTRIFSSVGNDVFGKYIVDQLKAEEIDTDLLSVEKGNTALAVYWLMHGNKKRPMAFKMSNFNPWKSEISRQQIDRLLDCDLLHCGGYLHYSAMYNGITSEIFKTAHERNIITSIDTQFPLSADVHKPWSHYMEDIIPYVDVLIMDENEARAMTGDVDLDECAKKMIQMNGKIVVIKMGEKGSLIYSKEDKIVQKAIKIGDTIDTIGAGDAFGAAFMTYYMENKPLEICAKFAAAFRDLLLLHQAG